MLADEIINGNNTERASHFLSDWTILTTDT